MTISYACILIAAIMPMCWAAYAKFSSKGYDNSNPRDFLEKLQGRAKRAHFAQLNSFEAFPAFAVAVILAHLTGVTKTHISFLAVSFIVLRIFYGVFYISGNHALRSLAWFLSFGCVVTLYVSAILRT